MRRTLLALLCLSIGSTTAAQSQFSAAARPATPEELEHITARRAAVDAAVERLSSAGTPADLTADVAIYSKAADWIVRHAEFYNDKYAGWTVDGLDRALARARELEAGNPAWPRQTGRLSRGFVSRVDRSVQPYGLVIPADYGAEPDRKWRLDVELHGRGATLNEVSFLNAHDSNQPVPADQDYIQLDIFGRTNNAYRWAGETDVFEAIESVRRRYRIDEQRIVLRGFSMGGAGSWHLGLHYPHKWCSVGPGAGFTDTIKYQKIDRPLPAWQAAALNIYDAEAYALNAMNVPIVAYGGENDPQLAASRNIQQALEQLGVEFELDGLDARARSMPFLHLVGPKTGHQIHPESRKKAMAFHAEHAARGAPYFRDHVRFITYTLKYPGAFGYTALRLDRHYDAATIEASRGSDGVVNIDTKNVAMLEVSRGVGTHVQLGGERFDLQSAAGASLPTVLFARRGRAWDLLDYTASLGELRRNYSVKRPGLQGPIDDAFTAPFLCVRGTGEPWSPALARYADWSLDRFQREWDKWLRGTLPVKLDSELTPQDVADHNLILFGDPGSNRVLRELADRLPIRWTHESIRWGDDSYSPDDHAVVFICPNPNNARRYVVVNSGHTFHAAEFRASNAQLYPRLGDYAVLRLDREEAQGFLEHTVHAGFFDERWKLPARPDSN